MKPSMKLTKTKKYEEVVHGWTSRLLGILNEINYRRKDCPFCNRKDSGKHWFACEFQDMRKSIMNFRDAIDELAEEEENES